MKSSSVKYFVLAGVLATFVAGCGSSSNDTDDTSPEPSTTTIFGPVDSISVGEQTITVNGYQLETTQASVSYEDNILTTSAITQGTQVEIETLNASAQEIELDPAVTGIVTAIQADHIVVNGEAFYFDQLSDNIAIGSWVMISAKQQSDASWLVSSIDNPLELTTSEVEGRISSLNIDAHQFNIGTIIVNYSNAEFDDKNTLQVGLWVEVFGQYSNHMLDAIDIDIENQHDYHGAEVEGTVTWVNSEQSHFELNGHTKIKITAETRFEDGSQSDLSIGDILNVDLIEKNQALLATEIDFESQQTPVSKSFSLEGLAQIDGETFMINHIEFALDAGTYFDDGLTLASLNNTWVEIEGIESISHPDDTLWLVKEVDKEQQEQHIDLEGPVENNTLWNYASSDNSLSQFNGQWVEVECQLNGDDLLGCKRD
ncbi:hypothetical protein Sps_01778 [Shewanella psychrophila]|uniref:DUF5666 domain-containing protein n=1 Tax=Shewanella psychrophila TaxID=225848 RepID=A0A1S6HN61_9GAMM|nr:DUF5666 domain-containing protein [Shewanella psychrophila]AQS36942.1 hypothetical protein Sps_01778 [Shewanella psychrophila]